MWIIMRIFLLVLLAVVGVSQWPEFTTQVMPGLRQELSSLIGLVAFGLVAGALFSFGRKPKVQETSSIAGFAPMLERLQETQSEILAQVDNLKADIADVRKDGGKDILEDLKLLQAFDPSVGQKIPQLMQLMQAVNAVKWPTLNFAPDLLQQLQAVVEVEAKLRTFNGENLQVALNNVTEIADKLEELYNSYDFDNLERSAQFLGEVAEPVEKARQAFASADADELEKLADNLEKVDAVMSGIEKLRFDDNDDDRDFDYLKSIAADAGEAMKSVLDTSKLVIERGEDIANLATVVDNMDTVMSSLENLRTNEDNYDRDFDDLKTTAEEAGTAIQSVMTAMKAAVPEGVSLDDAVKNIEALGTLVTGLEDVVLDDDGDTRDFTNLQDGIDGLKEVADKLESAQFFRRTA